MFKNNFTYNIKANWTYLFFIVISYFLYFFSETVKLIENFKKKKNLSFFKVYQFSGTIFLHEKHVYNILIHKYIIYDVFKS